MESFQTYPERCNSLGLKPLTEVLTVLAEERSSLTLKSKTLNEQDFYALTSVIVQDLPYLQDLNLSNCSITEKMINLLVDSLARSTYIVRLTLSSCELSYRSIEALTGSILESNSLEYLDLSSNSFKDLHAPILGGLFESQLKILIFDNNCFEDVAFSEDLSVNKCLLEFSISYNSLTYTCLIGLLEVLNENKTLKFLGLQGIQVKGAAPIKENASGLLDAQEALILKLSYILRTSTINTIGIDITTGYALQLKELENTMIKHNKCLFSIESSFIDWDNLPVDNPLNKILLAMKANKWITENTGSQPPNELKEILRIKENYQGSSHDNSKAKISSKNSLLSHIESENEETEIQSSPHFAGKDRVKDKGKDGKIINVSQIFTCFEKLMGKFNELDSKVMKKIDGFEKRLQHLERIEETKSEASEKLQLAMMSIESRISILEKNIKSSALSDTSLKHFESLQCLNKKPEDSNMLKAKKLEESVKEITKKIKYFESNLEPDKSLLSKFASFEDRLSSVEKVADGLSSVNRSHNQTVRKIQKIEEMLSSEYKTPNKASGDRKSPRDIKKNEAKCKGNIGDEGESIILGTLLERVNSSFRESPKRSNSSFAVREINARAPSNDLKESLRKRGFLLSERHK